MQCSRIDQKSILQTLSNRYYVRKNIQNNMQLPERKNPHRVPINSQLQNRPQSTHRFRRMI